MHAIYFCEKIFQLQDFRCFLEFHFYFSLKNEKCFHKSQENPTEIKREERILLKIYHWIFAFVLNLCVFFFWVFQMFLIQQEEDKFIVALKINLELFFCRRFYDIKYIFFISFATQTKRREQTEKRREIFVSSLVRLLWGFLVFIDFSFRISLKLLRVLYLFTMKMSCIQIT